MDLRARVPDRCIGDLAKIAKRRKRSDGSADEERSLRQQGRTGWSEHPAGAGTRCQSARRPSRVQAEKTGVPKKVS
jgi:hypothetical protein